MADVHYVCTGSCGGTVTEHAFQQGQNVCESENCERKGRSLEMRMFCPSCEVHYGEDKTHECD